MKKMLYLGYHSNCMVGGDKKLKTWLGYSEKQKCAVIVQDARRIDTLLYGPGFYLFSYNNHCGDINIDHVYADGKPIATLHKKLSYKDWEAEPSTAKSN